MKNHLFSTTSPEFKVTNFLSIICASLVILIVILLKIYRPATANRTSLNLQTAIALVDVLRHILIVNTYSDDKSKCVLLAFFSFITSHLSVLLNVSISANLQLIYIHGIIPGKRWRIFIYSVPFIITLGIDFLALGYGVYGQDRNASCFLDERTKYGGIFYVIQVQILRAPGYIYCLVIFIIVALKITFTRPVDNAEEVIGERASLLPNLQSSESRQFAFRISFYPLTCFISHSGIVVIWFYDLLGIKKTDILSIWLFLGLSSIGILNLVSFMLDPAFKSALISAPDNRIENPEPVNRLTGLYRARNRPPTPYNSDYEEPNSDDNSDTQSIEYGPRFETAHQRYVRERTEEQERINNAMPTSFW